MRNYDFSLKKNPGTKFRAGNPFFAKEILKREQKKLQPIYNTNKLDI